MSEEDSLILTTRRDGTPSRNNNVKGLRSFSTNSAFVVGIGVIGVLAGIVAISQSAGTAHYQFSSSDSLQSLDFRSSHDTSNDPITSELFESLGNSGRGVDAVSYRKSGNKGRSGSRSKSSHYKKQKSASKGSNSKVAHVENSDTDDANDDGTSASSHGKHSKSTNDDTSSEIFADDTTEIDDGRSNTKRGDRSSAYDDDSASAEDDTSTTVKSHKSSRNDDATADDSTDLVADDPTDDTSSTSTSNTNSNRGIGGGSIVADDDAMSNTKTNVDSMGDDYESSLPDSDSKSSQSTSTGTISFKATNEYITDKSPVGVKYPWIQNFMVAEPFREATFAVQNGSTSDLYTWEIHKITNDNHMRFEVNLTGYVVTHTFGDIGDFQVYLKQKHMLSHRLIAEYSNVVRSRFVRREIRSLADPDRNTFFDAAEVLFNTSCEDGKAIYGEFFECIDVFTRLHNTLAGDPYCDHMHDGYGFLISHAALTLWFERVLQTVEPSVTVPYWDYTIEGEQVKQSGDVFLWRQSQVWADDWFGPANNEHTNHIVATGRWAYTTVKSGHSAVNFSAYTNAYGLMRAPWNQNMIPYVTRSNTSYGFSLTDLPNCKSHYDQMKYTSFSDFGKWVQYNPHGTTHLAIGGVFNANWRNVLKENDFILKEVPVWVLIGFAKQKNMFRNHWLNCPVTCAPDTPQSQCKCVCQDIESYLDDEAALLGVMDVVFAGEDYYFKNREGDNDQKVILKLLCNDYDNMNPVMGDSLEAASPQDISFWPTHPTVDRLFHHRRIAGMNDTDWPANAAWSVNGFAVDYCSMHNREDITPWPSLFESKLGPYSNDDLWNLMDPQKATLPYIYDTFEWAHCFEAGYPMDLLPTAGYEVIEDDDAVQTSSEDHPESQAPMPNLQPEEADEQPPDGAQPPSRKLLRNIFQTAENQKERMSRKEIPS